MKQKIKRFFGFFKMSNLKAEVAMLGFTITFKNVLVIGLVMLAAAFIAGYLLRLDYAYCAILAIFFVACLPSMIITRFKSDYEKTRFNDTVSYLEKLIYAFHKNNKIREALVDVHDVSRGTVRKTIGKMLDILDTDMSTSKLYEKAFDAMQAEYNCSRMKILHNYLIEIENNGGESGRSLNMLLEDIRAWSERILVYQQERRAIKGKVTLSIFFAMLFCGVMINLIPDEYTAQIVMLPLYQVGTLIILLACIALYVVCSNKVGVSYLDFEVDGETSNRAMREMQFIHDYSHKNHVKPTIIKACIMVPFIIIAVVAKVYWSILPISALTLFVVFNDVSKKNIAVSHVVREVNKMFPSWIRSLVLYLQTDNVHVSIKKSHETCPSILKSEVGTFLDNLNKDPNSTKPYDEFLREFDVPNLKMSVNYLYSIAQFGTGDMLAQLDYLVKQNSQLSISEERLRNEDSLAGFGVLVLLPMLFAVLKMVLDLVLFLQIFTTYMSSFGAIGGM